MRHLGGAATLADPAELTGEDIKALREQANLSQAVFASYLKLTVGYVPGSNAARKARKDRRSSCSMSSAARALRRFFDCDKSRELPAPHTSATGLRTTLRSPGEMRRCCGVIYALDCLSLGIVVGREQ